MQHVIGDGLGRKYQGNPYIHIRDNLVLCMRTTLFDN